MAPIRRFAYRLLAFVLSGRAERELDREFSSHLALLQDEYER